MIHVYFDIHLLTYVGSKWNVSLLVKTAVISSGPLLQTSKNGLNLNAEFMVPPLVLSVQGRLYFPDKQRLENGQLQAPAWACCKNFDVRFTRLPTHAWHEMFPHWLLLLRLVFSESNAKMTTGSADIAQLTLWTCYLIYHSTLDHRRNCTLQRW